MITTDSLLIEVTLHDKEKQENTYICTNTLVTKHDRNVHINYNPLSATDQVALSGIYICLPLLPILYFLYLQQALQ